MEAKARLRGVAPKKKKMEKEKEKEERRRKKKTNKYKNRVQKLTSFEEAATYLKHWRRIIMRPFQIGCKYQDTNTYLNMKELF
jgi:hypothetical protein